MATAPKKSAASKSATNVAVGADVVLIGCKLPHGLIIDHPLDPSKKVELNGPNKSVIIGATHGSTEVDAEFWATWKTVHADFPPLKSGAIFEAGSVEDLSAIAAERSAELTGFERLGQNSEGVKVMTADNE